VSYRKMIDFKDLSRDEGLYARLAGLQLITEQDNPDGMFDGAGPGTIRQLTIWDTALTAAEVAAIPAP
jgi:hypothetical protein